MLDDDDDDNDDEDKDSDGWVVSWSFLTNNDVEKLGSEYTTLCWVRDLPFSCLFGKVTKVNIQIMTIESTKTAQLTAVSYTHLTLPTICSV